MKYKAIISDIDGTIMRNTLHGIPSPKVTRYLKKAKRKVSLSLATARSLVYTHHLFDHLEITDPSIILGGCQIIDAKTRKILKENYLDYEVFSKIISVLKKQTCTFFIDEPEEKCTYNSTYHPKKPLNIYIPQLRSERADEIREALLHIPSITVTKATDWGDELFALNVAHSSSTKQHAVLQVAQLLGISTEEIIGIGDGYNDFPLLMACGLKVAMGNAVEDLKAIADYIAPTVDEDGITDVIEKFVLS